MPEAKPTLPGNQGQFGESTATEAHQSLRATHRGTVKPVVPRSPATPSAAPNTGLEDEPEAHPT